MAINRKEVLKTNTLEEQRVKINELAQDLFDVSTGATSIDRLLIDGAIVPESITDVSGSSGKSGQFLASNGQGGITWKSLQIENVLWVTKDGSDENDGLSQETAKSSIGAALRAANSGFLGKVQDGANQILINRELIQEESIGALLTEFKDYAVGGKYIDAYDDILANKEFIAQESVARMLANNPGFVIPNGNQNCVDDVKIFIDNVAFNVKYGGNQKVYDAAEYYINFTTTIEGERDRSIEVYREAAYLMMSVMRHEVITGEIVGTHGLIPTYKENVILDVLEFTSQRALDASIVIEKNKNLIAYEAYARMKSELNWIAPGTTTDQDCIDDILTIIDQLNYDLTYGGNSKIYDSGLLYINNTYIDDGQRDAAVNAWIKAQYLIFDIVRQRDISTEITGTHGYTQYIDPNLILDPLEAVSQLHLDAYRLIDINKQFIAAEAYDLMLDQFPGFTPTSGTVNDCLDDVYDVIDAVKYNLIYGGNDQVYDAADIYINDPSLANEDREEASVVFDKVKDLCIDVMRNITIVSVGGLTNTYTQYIDSNVIVDTNNPTCQNVASSLGTLFDIIIDAIWSGSGNTAGTITATRTTPTPATVFGGGCSDINFTIANLFTILIQAIGTDSEGVGNLTGITRSLPSVPTTFGKGCVDVATAIWSLTQIYLQAIGNDSTGVGNLTAITRTLSQRFVFPDSPPESGRYKDARNLIYSNIDEIQDRALADLAVEYPDFNFLFVDNPELQRYKDAANLILANKEEIQDKALASIAVAYDESEWGTDWIIPGSSDPGRGVFYDSYRLIQLNRQEIIDGAYVVTGGSIPSDPSGTKCKRDIGYFVDAISLDVFLGSNIYARKFTQQYFGGDGLLNSLLAGEVPQSILAFAEARDMMISAIQNDLTIKDLTVTSNLSLCAPVESAITTLSTIVIDNLTNGNTGSTISLPTIDQRDLELGGSVCRRDVGYLVESIARDVRWQTNRHAINFVTKYFDNSGVIYLNGEEVQSVVAFETARDQMYLAVTNNLYSKDLTLTPDPVTESNTDPASCANVQSNIADLISIVTQPLVDQNLDSLPSIDLGNYPGAKDSRYQDSYRLIQKNKQEIIDRAAAEIAVEYPDFIYPNDPASDATSRYKDSYRLIQRNRKEITERSLAEIALQSQQGFYFPDQTNQEDGRSRYWDSYRLIQKNRDEILDRALAEIALQYTEDTNSDNILDDQRYPGLDWIIPGNDPTGRGRFYDAYRLIQVNRQLIIDEAYTTSIPSDTNGDKCKRDIGYFIDAISLDVFTGSNKYCLKFIGQYFNNGSFITNGLDGEEAASVLAFETARDLMVAAIQNQLTTANGYPTGITDSTVSEDTDPGVLGFCTDVASQINSETEIITSAITSNTLPTDPIVPSIFENGSVKCRRDIGHFVDALALDLAIGGNYYAREFVLQYILGTTVNHITNDTIATVYSLTEAVNMMRKAVSNQLYEKELNISAGEASYGDGLGDQPVLQSGNINSCVDVQNNLTALGLVVTDAIAAGDQTELAPLSSGIITPSNTKCLRDIGYFVDYLSLDIALGGTIKYIRKFVQSYFNADGDWLPALDGEETLSIVAFQKATDEMKKAVTNQLYFKDLTLTPDPLTGDNTDPASCANVQTTIDLLSGIANDVITEKSLLNLPAEVNYPSGRYQDSSNLIFANKNEIADRALAEIAIQHPGFIFPNNPVESIDYRYYDAYRLIQLNKGNIVDDAWAQTLSQYPAVGFTETKCKRDLGYLVDAISLDVFIQGNRYSKEFVLQYFDAQGNPSTEVSSEPQKSASIFAFETARDLMFEAITNNSLYTEPGISTGEAVYGDGNGDVLNNVLNACSDVQTTVANLTTIITTVIEDGNLNSLPYTNNGVYETGTSKCKRDLGYLIDGVIKDLYRESNVNSKNVALGYFIDNQLAYVTTEGVETITAFNKARDIMKLAINNQLYKKDLTLPDSGDDSDPAYTENDCANVKTTIDNLVFITTNALDTQDITTVTAVPDDYGIPAPGESICKRDIEFFVDAISLDIFLGAGNKYARKAAQSYFITNTVPLYPGLVGEESASVTAFIKARDMMQKAVTNQLFEKDLTLSIGDPTFEDGTGWIPLQDSGNPASCVDVQNSIASLTEIVTDTLLAGNLNSLPIENDNEFDRFDDAANMIGLNRNEIADRALAEIAIQHPDFSFPGDDISNESSRYFDSYRLIQQNKTEIVNTAFANTEVNPLFTGFNFAAVETKCKRDLGYFVDAISLDVFTQGNRYSKEFTLQYFSSYGAGSLDGELVESIFAFNEARELMKKAIANQLLVKDLTLPEDPNTLSNIASNSCSNVQTLVNNLVSIVTTALGAGNTTSLESLATNPGIFQTSDITIGYIPGGKICRRDIGYLIDAVIDDLKQRSNTEIQKFARGYFDNNGNPISNGLVGEEAESITAFNKARDVMKLAINNQLYIKNFDLIADPETGSNNDPTSCANVQTTIDNLVSIATTVINDGDLDSLNSINIETGVPKPKENLCRRDIGYIARSIAEDLYSGGNYKCISAVRAYFDNSGAPISNGLVGEELPSIFAFRSAANYIKKAITNQLFNKDLGLFEGPEERGIGFAPVPYTTSGNPKTCIDVQNAVDTLVTLITNVISDGNLSSLDSITENRGRDKWTIKESVCFRDIGYVINAVATDLKIGGNVNCTDVGNFYYDKNGNLIYIDGELEQSLLTYGVAKDIMKYAVNNWSINASDDKYVPKYSFIKPYINPEIIVDFEYPYCSGVTDSVDNYFSIIEYVVLNGPFTVEVQLPSFKTTIFVKSGVYVEQNPIVLPPNTGIFGDNLRDVSIYPANPEENLIYCENGGYITNVTFSGHLAPSYTCSFPKVKMQDDITKTGSGVKGSYELTVNNTYGLKERMYVLGDGIATAAIITKIQDKKIYLSTANEKDFTNTTLTFQYFIGTAGVITRSPYIQNCTSLTTTGSGLCVDGNLAYGTASYVLDSYTQYNQGGDGIVIVNGGYTQLVSIFEICCNRAVYLTAGSTCSITNSNTDFGNYGLVSDGVGPLQYTCKVDGTQNPGSEFNLKNLPREPYVGQGITVGNNGNPYYFIEQINITDGGSGYQTPPLVEIADPTGPSGIPAQAIANVEDGVITSITLISSGSQFINPPNITFVGGDPTVAATAQPQMYPQYYSILTSTDIVDGKATITTDEVIPFDLNDGDEVYFYQLTKIIANSHCMEYVGAGTKIQEAIPARGGVPIQTREVVELNGGKVAFTSTDHLGNFRIGQGLQINQNTGTLSGDSFQRSLFVTVTPFILALS